MRRPPHVSKWASDRPEIRTCDPLEFRTCDLSTFEPATSRISNLRPLDSLTRPSGRRCPQPRPLLARLRAPIARRAPLSTPRRESRPGALDSSVDLRRRQRSSRPASPRGCSQKINSEIWGEWGVTYGENGCIFGKPELERSKELTHHFREEREPCTTSEPPLLERAPEKDESRVTNGGGGL